jgi:hypothetical protein
LSVLLDSVRSDFREKSVYVTHDPHGKIASTKPREIRPIAHPGIKTPPLSIACCAMSDSIRTKL